MRSGCIDGPLAELRTRPIPFFVTKSFVTSIFVTNGVPFH
jgi:hypothetical protein